MAKEHYRPDFNISWRTISHYSHPLGDIMWHLLWGIVVGFSIFYSIFAKDFLFLVIAIIALIFFFHPFVYESITNLDITLDKKGVTINHNFYPWEDFIGFEVFNNEERFFIYLIHKQPLHMGITLPLEWYMDFQEIKKILNEFLDEYDGAVPFWEKWYRNFLK
jgi:hypothetical protein